MLSVASLISYSAAHKVLASIASAHHTVQVQRLKSVSQPAYAQMKLRLHSTVDGVTWRKRFGCNCLCSPWLMEDVEVMKQPYECDRQENWNERKTGMKTG